MDNHLQNNYSKLVFNIISAIRKLSLYPAQHPAVISSIKDIYSALLEILKAKDTLTLSLSPENKLIIENEPFNEKDSLAQDLIMHLKKLNLESITFNQGVSEKEIDDFLRRILLNAGQLKAAGDMNKALLDKNIRNIKANQFSYIKIDKDSEPLVVKKGGPDLDALKSALKELSSKKAQSPEEFQNIEKQAFDIISAEFKDKKKISPSTKSAFKKFLLYAKDKGEVLVKLKDTLSAAGFLVEDIDSFLSDIEKEKLRKTQGKPLPIIEEENERLKKENAELKLKLSGFQQTVNRQVSEKERIDNVIHHMAEGLVVVDPQGNIVMVNPSAEKLLNISKDDIGKPVKEVIKDEHLLTLVKKFPSAGEQVLEKDIELYSPNDSTKKILRTSSAVIEDPDGNTVGMVTTLNDITRQKELEALKSNFLAGVTHELRTPLVATEKSISLILNKTTGEISETQAQFLSIAERNLKRLTLLINDLLDLTKLEAGKMAIKRQASSIEKVINESVQTLNNWAKTKSINIRANVQEGLPEINMDPDRIIQVLNNLIGNALKFTPDNGTITVEAVLNKEKEEAEVSVTDTGIGISEENLAKVFDKFYQVGEKIPSDIAGTGIGLSIAKEIVELHAGAIRVDSKQGSGTKFTFTLPLKDSTNINRGD